MTKAKGRVRREAGLTRMEGQPPEDEPGLDNETVGTVEEIIIEIGDAGEDRVIQRQVFGVRHKLIDFCLQQEIKLKGKWRPVVRYDCAHGVVHADIYSRRGGRPRKEEIAPLTDIDSGYEVAEESTYG